MIVSFVSRPYSLREVCVSVLSALVFCVCRRAASTLESTQYLCVYAGEGFPRLRERERETCCSYWGVVLIQSIAVIRWGADCLFAETPSSKIMSPYIPANLSARACFPDGRCYLQVGHLHWFRQRNWLYIEFDANAIRKGKWSVWLQWLNGCANTRRSVSF